MSEIERIKDAIYDAAAGDMQSSGVSDRLAALLAHAAVEAFREPTLAQRTFLEGKTGVAWIEGWHAMIDEMLK